MGKNEDAWDILFAEHGVLDKIRSNGKFEIKSIDINRIRQSRLMTKFDHRANLPEIFRKNKLAILPVTRGSYVISDFEAYLTQYYDRTLDAEDFEFPSRIESLAPSHIYSEAAAINAAYISGMIDEIVGEKIRPTVSGRMGTSRFGFRINSMTHPKIHEVLVDNCQCEIDGGFEGDGTLAIIEAKNAISEDFIIRQLYYPYRLWSEKIRKRVIPIFLSYSNDVFHFFVYEFKEAGDYNSIQLAFQRNFSFAPEKISMDDLNRILDRVAITEEPKEPFPQADRFERVVDLLGLLAGGVTDGAAITRNYDFDPRQTFYYTSACRYLGLLEGEDGQYSLTRRAVQILRLGFKSKYLALSECILAHEVFNKTFRLYLQEARRPESEDVIEIMKSGNLHGIGSDSTYRRRAQTVIAWAEWVFALQSSAG